MSCSSLCFIVASLKHKSLCLLPCLWVATCHSFIIFPLLFLFHLLLVFWLLLFYLYSIVSVVVGGILWFFSYFLYLLFLNPCLCLSSMVDLILHSAYLPCLFFLCTWAPTTCLYQSQVFLFLARLFTVLYKHRTLFDIAFSFPYGFFLVEFHVFGIFTRIAWFDIFYFYFELIELSPQGEKVITLLLIQCDCFG